MYEIIWGFSIKEILEVVIVGFSFFLAYVSYQEFLSVKKQNLKYVIFHKQIFYGFLFFFFSMLFELIDSFYLEEIFDEFQLYTGIIAFIFLFIGFIGLWQTFISRRKKK